MTNTESHEIDTGAAPPDPAQAAPDEAHDAVHRAITVALRLGMTQTALAKQAGLSAPVVSQWLKGGYRGDNVAVQSKLAAWLETRDAIATVTAAVPGAHGWINTPTGQDIEKALIFARSSPGMAVIYGVPGVGKTEAIRHYSRTTPNVWVITASPSRSSMAAILRRIGAALELPGGYRNYDLACDIERRLKGTRGLLVIDEAQHLSLPALEEVRSVVYDAAEIGLALCGNESVYSRISGGTRRADFAQLSSRAAPILFLKAPQAGDVAAILAAWNITGDTEKKFAMQIASMPGGLRGLVKTLEQAALFSPGAASPDASMMRAAWKELWSAS